MEENEIETNEKFIQTVKKINKKLIKINFHFFYITFTNNKLICTF